MQDFSDEILNVYGQTQWHNPVYIVGSRKQLSSLKEAINQALTKGLAECENVACVDGEGYDLRVMCIDDKTILNNLAQPYSDEMAQELDDNAIWPEALFSQSKLKEPTDVQN